MDPGEQGKGKRVYEKMCASRSNKKTMIFVFFCCCVEMDRKEYTQMWRGCNRMLPWMTDGVLYTMVFFLTSPFLDLFLFFSFSAKAV